MIWYIIFATVFSFQNGYVICTENVPSMEYGDPNDPRFNSVLVAINRYNRPSNTYTFLCVGALLTQEYVVTVASCLNGLNDDTEMVVYSGDILEGSALITAVFGLTFHPQTRGLNKNIALLWINFPQTTIGRLRFLSRPKSALNISTPTRIYILRFTFHQTENGNFTNGTERIWLDFRYGDKVQYPYSFAAFNTHGSQIPLQMFDIQFDNKRVPKLPNHCCKDLKNAKKYLIIFWEKDSSDRKDFSTFIEDNPTLAFNGIDRKYDWVNYCAKNKK